MPLANINVAKDVMLCTACGAASAFSEAAGVCGGDAGALPQLPAKPPKHLKLSLVRAPDGSGDVKLLHYRRIPLSSLFLIPFTCAWAGGSMFGIYGTQILKGSFDLRVSLFGIPFVIGSVVLVSGCLYSLFGKRVLSVKRGKGTFFSGVGPFGRRVRFSGNRETDISIGSTNYEVNGRSLARIELKNPGDANTVKICAGMDDDALEYVAAFLRQEFSRV